MKNLVISVFAIFMAACASTEVHELSSESNQTSQNIQPYQSIVISVDVKDKYAKANAENVLVDVLQQKGVQAFRTDQPTATMTHSAVVLIDVLDEGYDYDYDDYLATRGTVYLLGGEPGAGTNLGSLISWAGSGKYSLRITVYDMMSEKAVWSGTTYSNSSGDANQDLVELASFIDKQLSQRGLIAKS